MKTPLRRWITFLLIPFVVLEVVGWLYQILTPSMWFYPGVERRFVEGPQHFYFVGSSRVAAAVDETTFTATLGSEAHPVQALNLGQGASTMPMHYLGLEKLSRARPSFLRGSVVFIEAPGGLPDPRRWDSSWVYDQYPLTILPVLDLTSLRRFLSESRTPFSVRAYTAAAYFSHGCRFIPQARDRLMATGDRKVERGLRAVGAFGPPQPQGELTEAGGIQTGLNRIQLARAGAIADTKRLIAEQQPLGDWQTTVVADIVRLVQSRGGSVVFFEIPISSVQAEEYRTPLRQRERLAFAGQAREWKTTLLAPAVALPDEAFPDLWHLDKPGAAVFTEQLARAYSASLHP